MNTNEIKVTESNATETAPHQFCSEASELRFPRNQSYWPRVVQTDLGNKRPFIMFEEIDGAAKYRQDLGCATLSVFND